jgi:S1-C subfamily serine protease
MTVKGFFRIVKEIITAATIILLLIISANLTIGLVGLRQNTATRFAKVQEAFTKQDTFNVKVSYVLNALSKETEQTNSLLEILDMSLDTRIKQISTDIIKEDKLGARIMEKKLQLISVQIVNLTVGCSGSGATVKINDNYYILTAAHLVDKETDSIYLYENKQQICELEIVKRDTNNDLMLLQPKNPEVVPKVYTELAATEPTTSTNVTIVGNPASFEDVVSYGKVIDYVNQYMVITDNIWFGNSGGGVYDSEGRVVGIVSFLSWEENGFENPKYVFYGIVRLNIIKGFLADLNE